MVDYVKGWVKFATANDIKVDLNREEKEIIKAKKIFFSIDRKNPLRKRTILKKIFHRVRFLESA